MIENLNTHTALLCPNCDNTTFEADIRDVNGVRRLYLYCPSCGKYVYHVPNWMVKRVRKH